MSERRLSHWFCVHLMTYGFYNEKITEKQTVTEYSIDKVE